MNDLYKAILLSTIVALIMSSFFVTEYLKSDYAFHYSLARGESCPNKYANLDCSKYPPLFSLISSPFSFNPQVYQIFLIFLVTIVMGVLLTKITNNWASTLLYFSTWIPFHIIKNGLGAEALVIVLFLLFVWKKDWRIRFVLLFLGILAHSLASYLFLLYWILELSFEKSVGKNWVFVPPFFPNLLELRFRNILNWVWTTNPLIFLHGTIEGLREKKNHLLLLAFISGFYSLANPRSFWPAQIALIVCAGSWKPSKKGIVFCVLWSLMVFGMVYGFIQPVILGFFGLD